MGKGGQIEDTVTVSRFAELTGLSRERLRTWERRHGFPRPLRLAGGPRRYRVADAPRVLAVREAAEAGIPISRAIEMAERIPVDRPAGPDGARAGTASRLVESLPLPVAILSGPDPLVFEYLNPHALGATDARPGDPLPVANPRLEDSRLHEALMAAFARGSGPAEVEHPPWTGSPEGSQRTFVFRLATVPGEPPRCALVSIDAERERRDRQALSELAAAHATEQRDARVRSELMRTAAGVSARLRSDDGAAVLRAATAGLREQLGAVDAGIALYMTGELVIGTSAEGLLGPVMVLVAAHESLGAVLRSERPRWLDQDAARAFGAPPRSSCLAARVVVGGEAVGMLLILFEERRELTSDQHRFIDILLGPVGFALVRDRFLETARDSAE